MAVICQLSRLKAHRSRTSGLRIMFWDLHRSVCVESISRLSGHKSDFQPLVESSLPALDTPGPLCYTIVCFASPLPYPRLWPRRHTVEQDLLERPYVIG